MVAPIDHLATRNPAAELRWQEFLKQSTSFWHTLQDQRSGPHFGYLSVAAEWAGKRPGVSIQRCIGRKPSASSDSWNTEKKYDSPYIRPFKGGDEMDR